MRSVTEEIEIDRRGETMSGEFLFFIAVSVVRNRSSVACR